MLGSVLPGGILWVGLIGVASAAPAQEPGNPQPVTAEPSVSDASIQSRLEAIYSSLGALDEVQVGVRAGVVTLRGTVPGAQAGEEAESIARRIEGAVAVENRIAIRRDLGSLGPAADRLRERVYDFLAWLPLLVLSMIILAGFALVAKFAGGRRRFYERLSPNRFVRDLARQAVRLAVLLVGLLLVLEILDATALVGAVLGTAGVAGLALGFAFHDLVENYIASVLLGLRRPFSPNDHVVIDGQEGRVVYLTSRATILLTLDGNHLRIPNGAVFKASILNYTRNPSRRFHFDVGVSTEHDLARARGLGAETLREIAGVSAEPPPFSTIEKLGDSSVVVRFFGWVDQERFDFKKVRSAGIARVKGSFDRAGIEMPEPIFRVRTVTAEPRAPSPSQPPGAVDLSRDEHLDRQVAAERAAAEEDLLETALAEE